MTYPQRPQAMPVPLPAPSPATAPPTMEDYYRALHELQTIDFVLVELTLYLDTHQDDTAALEQFNRTCQQRDQMKRQFEARFGPLIQYSSPAGQPFTWATQPWPWEV